MDKTFTFAVSKTGASHLPKGVPCQDYSLSWESEDGQNLILIVCDGHGSATYVRSDIGSRLAGEIAKEKLIDFLAKTSPELFIGSKGSVTSRPTLDENLWGAPSKKSVDAMTEVELMLHKQNQQFYQQVQGVKEQDRALCTLFKEIYKAWMEAIQKDRQEKPFTEEEQKALDGNQLVKAYGTTLMAFVKTPFYWLSFHIGDGRINIADRGLNWSQPVPWDCRCFQNVTTSLCNNNPLILFRYAFDGTGKFPVAVFCCSDGIEDSYGDFELAPYFLLKFYNGLVENIFTTGAEGFLDKLSEFLPRLSAAGSKDDMSLAGYINLDAVETGIKESAIRAQRDEINSQHTERMKKQRASEEKLQNKQKELVTLKQKIADEEQKKKSFIEKIKAIIEQLQMEEENADKNIADFSKQLQEATENVDKMSKALNEEKGKNEEEDEKGLARKRNLKQEYDKLEAIISEQKEADISKWKELVTSYRATLEKDEEPASTEPKAEETTDTVPVTEEIPDTIPETEPIQ